MNSARAFLTKLTGLLFPIVLAVGLKWYPADVYLLMDKARKSGIFPALVGGTLALTSVLVGTLAVLLLYTRYDELVPLRKKGRLHALIRSFTGTTYLSLISAIIFLIASVVESFWVAAVSLTTLGWLLARVLNCVDQLEMVCLIVTRVTVQDYLSDEEAAGPDETPEEDHEGASLISDRSP